MRIALNIFSLLNLKEAKRKDRYLQFFLYRTILFCILDLDYEFEMAFGMQVCHLSFKKKIVSQLSKFMKHMTSLVVQWIRICLPMQGDTGSISLVREDCTCPGATEPMNCNN